LLVNHIFGEENVEFHGTAESLTFVLDSLQDSTMELGTGNNFGFRSLNLSLVSNLEDTTEAVSTVECIDETLNFFKARKVMGDEFIDR